MTWTRHTHAGGQRIVWLEEGRTARAIALDSNGVHPRLDAADHTERPVLRSLADAEAYWTRRGLDDAAVNVLILASALLVHLRRGLLSLTAGGAK